MLSLITFPPLLIQNWSKSSWCTIIIRHAQVSVNTRYTVVMNRSPDWLQIDIHLDVRLLFLFPSKTSRVFDCKGEVSQCWQREVLDAIKSFRIGWGFSFFVLKTKDSWGMYHLQYSPPIGEESVVMLDVLHKTYQQKCKAFSPDISPSSSIIYCQ